MTMIVDIVLVLVLITIGYISVCYYLNNVRWNTVNLAVLKLTRNKFLYLLFSLVSTATLIMLFHTVYNLSILERLKLLSLVLILLPVAAVDYRLQKIPNPFLLAALAIRLVVFVAEFMVSANVALGIAKDCALGAAVVGGFFLLMLVLFKNSIGMGDIKLFAVMGLYQGLWGSINSVFFSLMASFLLSVGLLLTRKKSRKDVIPFGPAILIGSVVAIGLAGM